jgi:adenine-specific DNA methylase
LIPKECKRLAEVDFPIAVVSKHSAREKSIRHGHPSTLHLWWARRPLAACRAVLMALLLPDPADPQCPGEFKQAARRILLHHPIRPGRWETEVKTDEGLRHVLLQFIGDLADWDNASSTPYLRAARDLVKAAHGPDAPLVVDPFSGGGAIPLEALRVGCDAFASDLNPVACLILKTLLEDIPRKGADLAEELRQIGSQVKAAAVKQLAQFYPPDPDGAKPIAYLWARTVRCESPQCGAEIPLTRSFWLCKKASRRKALRHEVVRPRRGVPHVTFEVFEPKRESDVPSSGTVSRAKATCLCCGATVAPDRVRAQLAEQCGGADVVFDERGHRVGGAFLLAVVTLRPGTGGRHYRVPTARDYETVWNAQQQLTQLVSRWEQSGRQGICPIPDEALPPIGTLGFRVQRYGMLRWGDMFTARQKIALSTYATLLSSLGTEHRGLTLAFGKLVDLANSLCPWEPVAECPRQVMNQGRVKPPWDFGEGVPLSESSASFDVCLDNHVAGVLSVSGHYAVGQVAQAMAQQNPLPDDSASVCFTDPPYYDAIPYSDLSDFFLTWFKRARPADRDLQREFEPGNPLAPKCPEIVHDETKKSKDGRVKDRHYFEDEMAKAFAENRRILRDDGIGSVVFAHKTTEGWEALLAGMSRGGWIISGSWPIATEMAHRLRARDSAALATSVHLVCRPRPDDAPVGDWGDVLRELPRRVAEWMERLQGEGVRGADLVFACIGPALEIYSRYSKVVDPQEREIPLGGDPEAREPYLRGYLAYVWEVVGRAALNQVLGTAEASARNGAAGALEEDARLTALFLWTLQATAVSDDEENAENAEAEEDDAEDEEGSGAASGKKKKGFSLIYDVARRFAQPLGIHMEVWEKRIIDTDKGVVRLLPVLERAEQLFGEDGASAVADRLEKPGGAAAAQGLLFPQPEEPPRVRGRRGRANVPDEALRSKREATTLDRVHAAMLLQASGRSNALRALLKAELERGPDFLRLANALSALYPQGSDEKRLVDAMLLAVPR